MTWTRTCVTLLVLAAALPAQQPLFQRLHVMQRNLPLPSWLMALEDVDGDGHLDQIRRAYDRNVVVFGDGQGGFDERLPLFFPPDGDLLFRALAAADVDGDGDLDVLTGNARPFLGGVTNRLWLQQGAGGFVLAPPGMLPAQPAHCLAVLLEDVDGDGDPDAVLGVEGPDLLYLNDGQGWFTEAPSTHFPHLSMNTTSLAASDVDGDGDTDLVLGVGIVGSFAAAPGRNSLLLNAGQGVFVDVTSTNLPFMPDPTASLLLTDLDGDADPDLVVGNQGTRVGTLLLNDGSGVFWPASQPFLQGPPFVARHISADDIDGDGDADLLLSASGPLTNVGSAALPYMNDGQGVFAPIPGSYLQPLGTSGRLVDIDGDSDLDILGDAFPDMANLLNDGQGGFVDVTAHAFPRIVATARNLELSDLDGDGDLDAFVVNSPQPHTGVGQQDRVFLNDGTGTFAELVQPGPLNAIRSGRVLVLSDLDLDGDDDAVVSRTWGGPLLHYVNDGSAGFTMAPQSLLTPPAWAHAATAADVNGDGYPDLLVATLGLNALFLNVQNGTLVDATATHLPPDADPSREIAVLDADGDGDLDLAVANSSLSGGSSRLLLNDGSGVFKNAPAGQLPGGDLDAWTVKAGDLDGDGDLDLWWGSFGQDRLFLNQGSGTFTDATQGNVPVEATPVSEVELADVDGDGDLDVLLAVGRHWAYPLAPATNRLYLNDGGGTFTDVSNTQMPEEQLDTRALAVGDVDGDGDPDLVVPSENRNRVYVNRTRQLSWRRIPRFDEPLRLDVAGLPGGAWQVAVSLGVAQLPAPPWGTLLIDPQTLLLLGSGVLDGKGSGGLTLQIPPDPGGLAGVSLYGQALVGTLQPRLTNRERLTFLDL